MKETIRTLVFILCCAIAYAQNFVDDDCELVVSDTYYMYNNNLYGPFGTNDRVLLVTNPKMVVIIGINRISYIRILEFVYYEKEDNGDVVEIYKAVDLKNNEITIGLSNVDRRDRSGAVAVEVNGEMIIYRGRFQEIITAEDER